MSSVASTKEARRPTLALERERGITIKTAVVSFVIDDVAVNLIDTLGHPDFIAEVERVLNVLDGAVLVVSAVEGVQPQTRILARTLHRLGVLTLIFVNKIDRAGQRTTVYFETWSTRPTPSIVAMGTTRVIGTRQADFAAFDQVNVRFSRASGLLAEHDEEIFTAYVDGTPLSPDRLERELRRQVGCALVHPVFFGSAITGAGVDAVLDGIARLLPRSRATSTASSPQPCSGSSVGRRGRRSPTSGCSRESWLSATGSISGITTRSRRSGCSNGATPFSVPGTRRSDRQGVGPQGVRVGDELGVPRGSPPSSSIHRRWRRSWRPIVLREGSPARPARNSRSRTLIDLRQDDLRQELSVSLYGEVQKEVIEATLARDYGLDVGFRETTMICVERPIGVGHAVGAIGKDNLFLATIGLRVEPAPIGEGASFTLDAPLNTLPLYVYGSVDEFRSAMEDTVIDTLSEGSPGR